ncbi:MAG TPA: ester cyclase [Steroidobacteraceae bacterium]|nr:ester cyclase [Steroidobacteraceae bacterium]
MSLQARNVAAIRAYFDCFNRHDIAAAVACFHEHAINHGKNRGRAGMALVHGDIFRRFPDVRMDILETVAAGDDVIVRTTYSGTHLGVGQLPIDGGQLVGVPPTGKHFSVQHIHWFTLKDGLIAEHRANRDDVGMLVQLGILPMPPPFPGSGN